jgi:microcystin-dependent protein
MSQPFLSEIKMFTYNFAPRGYAYCDGQLLSIAQNTALFSLLGTTYGGNGTTTFALPDLRSRTPLHFGTGPGLPTYNWGQVGGEENHTITAAELPQHTHTVNASGNNSDLSLPTSNYFGGGGQAVFNSPSNASLDASASPASGGSGLAHSNLQPYTVVAFCIALQGIFPSRN